MPSTTNLKGEAGGVFLSAGQSYTETDVSDYLLGFVCLSDTVIGSITMVGFDGTESEIEDETLNAGTTIYGTISSITVTSGLIQGLKH